MTLNMMQPCRSNPKMSAHAALEEEFNYNTHLLAPLGSKVIAFSYPNTCQTWALYGLYGWLIGPAMNHYRCMTVYNPKTNGIAIADAFR